jgi:hypothetical protein
MSSNTLPSREEKDQAVYAAYLADGYITPEGRADKIAVRKAMCAVLSEHVVTGRSKAERKANAIRRIDLMREVFPHLPGPDAFEDQDDPVLAAEVYKTIYQRMWSEARPGAGCQLQSLITSTMGNGYWLCRTAVDDVRDNALYVTDSLYFIDADHLQKSIVAFQRQADQLIADREALMHLLPADAKTLLRGFDRTVRQIMNSGHERLAIAAEAATSESVNGEAEQPEAEAA